MRTRLSGTCQAPHRRARNTEISRQKPVSHLPGRSARHLGPAERVHQTFLGYTTRRGWLFVESAQANIDGQKAYHQGNRV